MDRLLGPRILFVLMPFRTLIQNMRSLEWKKWLVDWIVDFKFFLENRHVTCVTDIWIIMIKMLMTYDVFLYCFHLQVQAMIEEEKKRYRPTKNYLEHLPSLELHKFEV